MGGFAADFGEGGWGCRRIHRRSEVSDEVGTGCLGGTTIKGVGGRGYLSTAAAFDDLQLGVADLNGIAGERVVVGDGVQPVGEWRVPQPAMKVEQ